MEIQFPSRYNFVCKQCGRCCSAGGDIVCDTETLSKLDSLVDKGELPPRSEWLDEKDGLPVLGKNNNSCVFLGDDNKCTLHDKWGSQYKPIVCRAYPYVFSPRENHWRCGYQFTCTAIREHLLETGEVITEHGHDEEIESIKEIFSIRSKVKDDGLPYFQPDMDSIEIEEDIKLPQESLEAIENNILSILELEDISQNINLVDIYLGLLAKYLKEVEIKQPDIPMSRTDIIERYIEQTMKDDYALIKRIAVTSRHLFGVRRPTLALIEIALRSYRKCDNFPPSPRRYYFGVIGRWFWNMGKSKLKKPCLSKAADIYIKEYLKHVIWRGDWRSGWWGLGKNLRESWAWLVIWIAEIMLVAGAKSRHFETPEATVQAIAEIERRMGLLELGKHNSRWREIIETSPLIDHVLTNYIGKKFFVPSMLNRNDIA